jgi:hypothetical protein
VLWGSAGVAQENGKVDEDDDAHSTRQLRGSRDFSICSFPIRKSDFENCNIATVVIRRLKPLQNYEEPRILGGRVLISAVVGSFRTL